MHGNVLHEGLEELTPGERIQSGHRLIEESHTDRQSTFLVRTDDAILDPAWTVKPVTLDDLVLAYMSQARGPGHLQRPALGVVS